MILSQVALLWTAALAQSEMPDGVLKLELTKPGLSERLRRRSDTADITLKNHLTMFTTQLSIGSNEQNITVLVDTGSSDLWVMSSDNPYCSSSSSSSSSSSAVADSVSNVFESTEDSTTVTCYSGTRFDASDSDTFSLNSTAFDISYGDGTFANGTYAQDTVRYGGATISNANFAFANESDSEISVFGIGLEGLEAIVTTYNSDGSFSPTYANLPAQMVEQGVIARNVYSLWLDDEEASQGTLLFGGIDHSKYSGSLETVPLLSSYSGADPNEFLVKLDSISVYQGSNEAQIVECAYPALLDSGTSFMMLPKPFYYAVLDSIGGVYATDGNSFADCDLTGGLIFDFSGLQVNVSFDQILFTVSSSSSVCQLGILPSSSSLVLGDTFLRSAYVVYDLENYEVAMAQANTSPGSSSVEAITSSIPSASQASGYSNTSVGTVYTTSAATFLTGTGDVTGVTTASVSGDASLGSAEGGSTVADTSTRVAPGGSIFSTIVLSTITSTSKSSSSESKSSSKDGAAQLGTEWFTWGFTSILGLLLYI